MNIIPRKKADTPSARPETVDELLAACGQFGRVTLREMSRGWYANCEHPTTKPGQTAGTASEFTHPTPADALWCLLERLYA